MNAEYINNKNTETITEKERKGTTKKQKKEMRKWHTGLGLLCILLAVGGILLTLDGGDGNAAVTDSKNTEGIPAEASADIAAGEEQGVKGSTAVESGGSNTENKGTMGTGGDSTENKEHSGGAGDMEDSSGTTGNEQQTGKEKSQLPSAFPETRTDAVKTVANGDRILLTTEVQGAVIYYTTDGTEPLLEEQYRYETAIIVSGDYGGNYMIRAISCEEGKQPSETAIFIYKISEKKILPAVTALPDGKEKVVQGDRIVLSCAEPGADIFYTMNGSTPEVREAEDGSILTGEGTFYYQGREAVVVPEAAQTAEGGVFCITAIARKQGMESGQPVQFVYTYEDTPMMPYSDPVAGSVPAGTEVLLQSDQKGAVIYYEIAFDGNEPQEPGTGSKVFTEKAPLLITRDTMVKAKALVNRQMSQTAVLYFQAVQPEALRPPEENSQSFVASSAVVAPGTVITLPGEGNLYYTTDGSDPMDVTNVAVNRGKHVTVNGKPGDTVTIRACAGMQNGQPGAEAVFTYLISQYPGGVDVDLPTGTVIRPGTEIHFSTDVTGGVISYTTGEGHPAETGKQGDSLILEGEPGSRITLKAVATAPSAQMSGGYAAFEYQLMEQLKAPAATVRDDKMLTKATAVELRAPRGSIYFTTDGTVPGKESWKYTEPILVEEETLLQAVVIEEGYLDSEISMFSYHFAPRAAKPTTSAASGKVDYGKKILLSSSIKDAEIYYTTDGSDPDPSSENDVFLYDKEAGIPVQRSVTIKAAAIGEGLCRSEVLVMHYTVDAVPDPGKERKEQEQGLIPLDTSGLASRREAAAGGLSVQDVVAADVIHKILLGAEEGALPADVSISAGEISVSHETEEELSKKLGAGYKILKHYDLAIYAGGERVEPQGLTEAGFPVPKGYEAAELMLARVGRNGEVVLMESRRENNGFIYGKLNSSGGYAVIGMVMEEESRGAGDLSSMAAAGAVVLSLGSLGWMLQILISRNKRKKI